MTEQQIRFTDGAGYERMMGVWSRQAGEIFLDWLKPRDGLAWVDVGCGNGAFTELLVERCAPARIVGVDPSPQQIVYARQRHTAGVASFELGDAMALPIGDDSVDAATMALVIFFVPEPARGVAEMKRVVRPGGSIAAYAWDYLDGGFPWEPVNAELRALGFAPTPPPSAEAGRLTRMRELWEEGGLDAVDTRVITVERSFASFEDLWATAVLSPVAGPILAAMDAPGVAGLKDRVRARVRSEGDTIVLSARANAVKGLVRP